MSNPTLNVKFWTLSTPNIHPGSRLCLRLCSLRNIPKLTFVTESHGCCPLMSFPLWVWEYVKRKVTHLLFHFQYLVVLDITDGQQLAAKNFKVLVLKNKTSCTISMFLYCIQCCHYKDNNKCPIIDIQDSSAKPSTFNLMSDFLQGKLKAFKNSLAKALFCCIRLYSNILSGFN